VAWECRGTVTVAVEFSGLPQTEVRLFVSPDPSLESGLPQGAGFVPGHGFVTDDQGRLEVVTSGIQLSHVPPTLQVRVRAGLSDPPVQQVTVGVEQCGVYTVP
jgi:hypothetical protein